MSWIKHFYHSLVLEGTSRVPPGQRMYQRKEEVSIGGSGSSGLFLALPSSTSSLHKAKYPRIENSSLQNFWQHECIQKWDFSMGCLIIWEKALFRISNANGAPSHPPPQKKKKQIKGKKTLNFEIYYIFVMFRKIIKF